MKIQNFKTLVHTCT